MASKADKIERIISRLQTRIGEGQYYEAQQQARVVAARYTKAANWSAAIELVASVAQALLKAGQGGSGGDLSVLLVDIYRQAQQKPDDASKARLLTCLRLFDAREPTRKKFITEMIGWSSKFGDFPAGDPELHHVVGTLFAQEREPYEAERHLVLGTRDSAPILADLEYTWYRADDPHTAPLYAARAVLPYLLTANVRAANTSYRAFTSALERQSSGDGSASSSPLGAQDVSSASAEIRVFPSLPLLNYLGLLLLAIQKASPDLFRQLQAKYAAHLAETGGMWAEPLEMIAEMYFGIQRPRQSNPLFDMMGSLFGGGGGGGAGAGRRPPPARRVEAPMADGLD